jgi:hypothetical protein
MEEERCIDGWLELTFRAKSGAQIGETHVRPFRLPILEGTTYVSISVWYRDRYYHGPAAPIPTDIADDAVLVIQQDIPLVPRSTEELEIVRDDKGAMAALVKAVY